MGKSAPGYALRGFPHAILNRLLTLQRKNGGVHNPHCATLQTSRLHDERLKPLGKFQRASLGTFKRAPTLALFARTMTHCSATNTHRISQNIFDELLAIRRGKLSGIFLNMQLIFKKDGLRNGQHGWRRLADESGFLFA